MKYKITVIIPTYNAKFTIENAVNSLIKQTLGFENIELIISDDNSNDGTKDLIKNLAINYKNVIPIFSVKNSGTASRPRNKGIKKSSADFIMFLDQDDEYYPEMCEKMYSTMKNSGSDVVTCRYKQFINGKINRRKSFFDKLNNIININSVEEFPELMTLGFSTMIWTKIFKKKVIIENNIIFPNGELYEDVYFCARFYQIANGIIILNDFHGYKYNLRVGNDKSTSQLFNKELCIKQFKGFKRTMNYFKEDNYPLLPELIIDMTKIFLYSNLSKKCQKKFLKDMNIYYKNYKLIKKVNTFPKAINIVLNIFIKIFSLNNCFVFLISKLVKRLK